MQKPVKPSISIAAGYEIRTGDPVIIDISGTHIVLIGDNRRELTHFMERLANAPELDCFPKSVIDADGTWPESSSRAEKIKIHRPAEGQETFSGEESQELLRKSWTSAAYQAIDNTPAHHFVFVNGRMPANQPEEPTKEHIDRLIARAKELLHTTVIAVDDISHTIPGTDSKLSGYAAANSQVFAFRQEIYKAARLAPILNLIPDEQRRLTSLREGTCLYVNTHANRPVALKTLTS